MKKSFLIIVGVAAMMVSWPSCTQLEETGKLQFGLELSDDSELKSVMADRNVSEALVSIAGENGALIFDKEPLPIYKFGEEYTTRSLKLPVGEFLLTEFMLIDSSGVVLWATPMEGSRLAHLVRQPLPIHFGISHEQTTSLDIQVIRVKDHPPADFGYVNFDIGFVDRFCLKVLYLSRCMEDWNDSILGPNNPDAPIHQPRFTMHLGDQLVVDEPLNQGLNHYAVPMLSDWYLLSATDCHGQLFYEQKIHLRELVNHRCTPDYPPLVIYHDPDSGIIITPEGLHEPTIRQGVFGSISLPLDSNTVTNDPDVWPVIRDIYFYPYAVLDSIYTFAPIDCYFPLEIIRMDPVAIVRSNSDGYFQVPLKEGDYLYMVKEDDRYYIDAYISSHRPGLVTVFPGEVTELLIHMVDCSKWQ
ncbi:MAG: hypothetical protein KAR19_19230 [Bacteroidales bacterium]|nr:hypothetical protein [Bacteroidales bacterium]